MTRIYQFETTFEQDDPAAAIRLRFQYTYSPGAREQGPSYDSGGQPADPPEIDIVDIHAEHATGGWRDVTGREFKTLSMWSYENHAGDMCAIAQETLDDERAEAMERRAELRREDMRERRK